MVLPTDFALDDPLTFQDVNETNTQVNTNTSAIAALQAALAAGVFPILLADPVSPTNNTWWLRRDGGSPEGIQLRVRVDGLTETAMDYTLAST